MDGLVHVGLVNAALAALLALGAAAVGWLYRRPALVHGLWLLVLLKLVTPPLLPVRIPWPARPQSTHVVASEAVTDVEAPVADGVEPSGVANAPDPPGAGLSPAQAPAAPAPAPSPAPGPVAAPPAPAPAEDDPAPQPPAVPSWDSWEPAVGAVWLIGSVAWWSLAVLRLYRFRRSLRHAVLAPAALQEQARRLAVRLGLRRCPAVWLLPAPTSPLLWAVAGAPRLLLPAGLWQRLTDEQRETLLAHELAHLRRGDPWVRRLELLVLGLYWWHPVVWWARREIQEAEEQCCDAWVVWAMPQAAHAYATALVETVAFLSLPRPALPLGASGIGHAHSLQRRLTMILKGTTPPALTWTALGALLTCGALLLPLRPTWVLAQPADAPARAQPAPAADVTAAGAAAPDNAKTDRSAEPVHRGMERGRDPQDVEEAKDEVELLKAQLEGKKAELQEAQALLQKARRQLKRLEQLRAGAGGDIQLVTEGQVDESRTDVAVRETRVRGKEAQIREAELRLRQASRRLSRLQGRGQPGIGAPDVPGLPIPAPGLVRPPSAGDVPAAPRNPEQRLSDLEKKLDRLLREMDALRREIRRQQRGEGPVPSGGTTAPAGAPATRPPGASSR